MPDPPPVVGDRRVRAGDGSGWGGGADPGGTGGTGGTGGLAGESGAAGAHAAGSAAAPAGGSAGASGAAGAGGAAGAADQGACADQAVFLANRAKACDLANLRPTPELCAERIAQVSQCYLAVNGFDLLGSECDALNSAVCAGVFP